MEKLILIGKMRKVRFLFEIFIFPIVCLTSFSCHSPDKLLEPRIKDCTAKVSGRIITESENMPELTIFINNIVTGEPSVFEISITPDGSFSSLIPLQTDQSIGSITVNPYVQPLLIGLAEGKETKLEIICSGNNGISVIVESSLPLTSYDIINGFNTMANMHQYYRYSSQKPDEVRLYDKDPAFFIEYMKGVISQRLTVVENDTLLSQFSKKFLSNEFKLYVTQGPMFHYREEMEDNFRKNNSEEDWCNYVGPSEPGRPYYSFLKSYDLNDPQYMYNSEYPKLLERILTNKTIGIPPIEETPIGEWLKEVKLILTDLIGLDSGLFYDLLISNAYSMQFKYTQKPLTEKQIANINQYFKEDEIAKIIFRKNNEIANSAEVNAVIQETPAVTKKELMDAIISRYEGKVVLVDFWATWCAPCLEAMQRFKEVKSGLKGQDIAFIYITTVSSPENRWRETLKEIEGDHYYLTREEWEYILDSFNFEGIPSYLLYDRNSKLKNKFTGYPGTKNMQRMIEDLL